MLAKVMKRYKEFINEGLFDVMKPKSDDDILKALGRLSNNEKIEVVIEYQLDFVLLPRDENGVCVYSGNLNLYNNNLTSLPDNLTIDGYLNCSRNKLTVLPNNLTVNRGLTCAHNNLTMLPDNLTIGGYLTCNDNNLTVLPDNLTIDGDLNCSYNNLTVLPDNLTVSDSLWCHHNKVELTLPPTAKVGGNFHN